MMASWQEFALAAPELAAPVRARFEATKHHVLATLRRDGSPRVSGTEAEFTGDGRLTMGSMAGAVKAADLKRDPRFALHANPGDGSMDGGDSKIAGLAVPATPPQPEGAEESDGSDLFELDIREVVHTTVEDDQLRIRFWKAGDEGVREIWRK